MFWELISSVRIAIASMLLVCVGYTSVVLGAAAVISPAGREGDLARESGEVVGSWKIAQGFTRPEYLWPRPSAVNYAADAAGGSNLSPLSPAITKRAREILARLGATPAHAAPADLVLASGSGLDPDITLAAARYQAPRVAAARGVDVAKVNTIIERVARRAGGSADGGAGGLVNVLRANVLLDREAPMGAREVP